MRARGNDSRGVSDALSHCSGQDDVRSVYSGYSRDGGNRYNNGNGNVHQQWETASRASQRSGGIRSNNANKTSNENPLGRQNQLTFGRGGLAA